jgi:hypothetical protein
MFRHGGGHDPNRARPGDQNVFAQQRKRKRGVYRVAKRVEDRRHVAIDIAAVMPDVRHRHRNILGKRPGAIDPDPDRVLA